MIFNVVFIFWNKVMFFFKKIDVCLCYCEVLDFFGGLFIGYI